MSSMFKLDPRLENDTIKVSETDTLLTLLMNDQRYPWIILVPKQNNLTELYDLPPGQYRELMDHSYRLGQELMSVFNGDKLNVAAIGNVVSQLHLHHVVRNASDASWPAPVWGVGTPEPYNADRLEDTLALLRRVLP